MDPSTVQHDIATLLVSRGISHTAAHQAATTIIDSIDAAARRCFGVPSTC